jgi:hypothetical protein
MIGDAPMAQTERFPNILSNRHLGNGCHAFGGVNARVILRPDNFDPLVRFLFLSTVDHLQGSFTSVLPLRRAMWPLHPAAGRLHLDALWWTAGAETSAREIHRRAFRARSSRLPSLPQASRSYDLPPPHCLDSLTPDAHRAGPLHPRPHSFTSAQRRPSSRRLTFDLLPLSPQPERRGDDLSCDSCSH